MFNLTGLTSPKLQANVSIYQILAGYVFSFLMGFLLTPGVRAMRLWRLYKAVRGRYAIQRVNEEGHVEPRFGEIKIEPDWWRGSFAITAIHQNGTKDWEGYMRLSLDSPDTGHGSFHHGANEVGDQTFKYVRGTNQFLVKGVTFGPSSSDSFYHRWTKKVS
jgi:hypothetical protein